MDAKGLEALRIAYNQEHPKEKPIARKANIWKEITHRLRKACKVASSECIVRNLMEKPSAPMSWKLNPDEWLSSDDIDNVQKGYAKLLPDYYYAGTVPIDFDKHKKTGECLVSALCSLNLNNLKKKGIRRVGIVFNTDVSTGPGEHWIAAFCDFRPELEKPQMTYFDSNAYEPEIQVQRLMQRWSEQLGGMNLRYNKLQHQYTGGQ